MTRLSDTPLVDPTAKVVSSTLGRYTEVGAHCTVAHSSMGDYSYCVENTQIAYAKIGKFANIASRMCGSMPACTRWTGRRCIISATARPGISRARATTGFL
jgi:hypothetical protein